MCRNIKILYNFDPPSTEEEIYSASVQFVRKISGIKTPSKINEEAFNKTVKDISITVKTLLNSLNTNSSPKNRELENKKAKLKSAKRFSNGLTK